MDPEADDVSQDAEVVEEQLDEVRAPRLDESWCAPVHDLDWGGGRDWGGEGPYWGGTRDWGGEGLLGRGPGLGWRRKRD